MNEKLTDILAECLDLIEREGWSIEECLSRYPAHREELSDLLNTVQVIDSAPLASPRPSFMKGAGIRLERKLADHPRTVTFSERLRLIWQTIILPKPRRFSMTKIITVVSIFTMLFGGVGVAFASTDALPGDVLYPVKTGIEDARLGLSGDEADVDLLLEFTGRRLGEIDELIEEDRFDDIEEAVSGYEDGMVQLSETQTRVSYDDAPSEDALTTRVQDQLKTQENLLLQLQERVQDKQEVQSMLKNALKANKAGAEPGAPEGSGKPEDAGSGEGSGQSEDSNGQSDSQGQQGSSDSGGKPEDAGSPNSGSGQGGEGSGENQDCIPWDGSQGQGGQGQGGMGSGGQGSSGQGMETPYDYNYCSTPTPEP